MNSNILSGCIAFTLALSFVSSTPLYNTVVAEDPDTDAVSAHGDSADLTAAAMETSTAVPVDLYPLSTEIVGEAEPYPWSTNGYLIMNDTRIDNVPCPSVVWGYAAYDQHYDDPHRVAKEAICTRKVMNGSEAKGPQCVSICKDVRYTDRNGTVKTVHLCPNDGCSPTYFNENYPTADGKGTMPFGCCLSPAQLVANAEAPAPAPAAEAPKSKSAAGKSVDKVPFRAVISFVALTVWWIS